MLRRIHNHWVWRNYLLKLTIGPDDVLSRHHWHLLHLDRWQVLGNTLLRVNLLAIYSFQIFVVKNFRPCTWHENFFNIGVNLIISLHLMIFADKSDWC